MEQPPQKKPSTRADLMGVNGHEAWERAVLRLVKQQSRAMVSQLYVFGVKGASVLNTDGAILISAS